ncbi:MAG TPA: drug/metabolite exporter YedA [Anaerolineae bacterium]|nr:drug/metabolite exporter YedA [Anaerolineae bacterium]
MTKLSLSSIPSRWRVLVAFAAIYTIWGSTYLAIRFAIETTPPFLMGGARYLIAGAILYALTRRQRATPILRVHWRSAFVVGGLLLLGGNGGVIWAEQVIPSGLAALIIATVPLWMALLNWLRGDKVRPNLGVTLGLVLGLLGIVFMVSPGESAGGDNVNSLGVLVLVLAALSWSIGSLYSRKAQLPPEPLLATAMEMLAGGALLLVAGLLTGEAGQLRLDQVSPRSLLALGYLIVFGSLVGFSAYVWLLRVSTPARVSTYAFVNPVVAVFLGWTLAGESLTPRTLVAAAVIVTAVVLIVANQARTTPRPTGEATPIGDRESELRRIVTPIEGRALRRRIEADGSN